MKKTSIALTLVLLILSVQSQTLAPITIPGSGGIHDNGSINLLWTVGEVATATISNSSTTLTQGFPQGVFTVTSTEGQEITDEETKVNVYPNPTNERLIVTINATDKFHSSIELYDLLGTLLLSIKMEGTRKELDLSNYSSSLYLLRVIDEEDGHAYIFKISKN